MSRWGKPRKNKKFIDPRYFMDEKMELRESFRTHRGGVYGTEDSRVHDPEPEKAVAGHITTFFK